MNLQKGDVIRVRLDGTDDEWCLGKVLLAGEGDLYSVAVRLDGFVHTSSRGIVGELLPLTIDNMKETATSLWGDLYDIELSAVPEGDDRDIVVATFIRQGICPFGNLQPGQTIAHCPLGFPGCSCGDELMVNPYLIEEPKPAHENIDKFRAYVKHKAATTETFTVRQKVEGHYRNVQFRDLTAEQQEHYITRWWREKHKK